MPNFAIEQTHNSREHNYNTMMTKADEMMRNETQKDLRYLTLLSKKFPTVAEACTEIINLEAILDLPKGKERVVYSHLLSRGETEVGKGYRVRY